MRAFLLLILVLVLAGLMYLVFVAGDPLLTEEAPGELVEESAAGIGGDVELAVEAKSSEQRELLPTELHRLRGRLLRAEDGETVVGARVFIFANGPRDGEKLWVSQPAVLSEADGSFNLAYPLHPGHGYRFSIRAKGRTWLHASFTAGDLQGDHDFGDLKLPAGIKVSGRVIDSVGNPLPGHSIRLTRQPLLVGARPPREEEFWNLPMPLRVYLPQGEESEALGAFEFSPFFPPGSWLISIDSGKAFVQPKNPIVLDASDSERVFDVVLEGDQLEHAILGRVVDESHKPVEGARIRAYGGRNASMASGESWSDGTFVLSPGLQGTEPSQEDQVFVSVSFREYEYESRGPYGPFKWGDRDLEIQVKKSVLAKLELQVVAAATGKPIENYGIRCFLDMTAGTGGASGSMSIRFEGHHENGILTIPRMRQGRHLLSVFPADSSLQALLDQPLTIAGDGSKPHRVELRQGVPVSVSVRRSDGQPVAGTQVELLQKSDYESAPQIDVGTFALAPEEMYSHSSGPEIAWLMGMAHSDEEGEAQMHVLPSEKPYVLRVMGPGHEAMVHGEVFIDENPRRLEVVVAAGASLSGRVIPPEFVARFTSTSGQSRPDSFPSQTGPLSVQLEEVAADGRSLPGTGDVWELNEDGSFELSDLPPGRWQVFVQGRKWHSQSTSSSTNFPVAATVELSPGQTTTIEVDARAFESSRINGQIMRSGEPIADAELFLLQGHPDGRGGIRGGGSIGGLRSDSAGRFRTDELSPCHYRIQWRVGSDRVSISDWFQLPAGKELSQVFDFPGRSLHLQLTESDGETPIGGAELRLSTADRMNAITLVTDASGSVTVDYAPLGELLIQANRLTWSVASETMSGAEWYANNTDLPPIQVLASPEAQAFKLQLPAKK